MHDTWVLGVYQRQQSSFAAERLEDGAVRVWDEFWEHTCLDVDMKSLWATERDRTNRDVDDPLKWDFRRYPLKREPQGWFIFVDEHDLRAWDQNWQAAVDSHRELARRSEPNRRAMTEFADHAATVLARVQSLSPGWNALAPAIQSLLQDHSRKQ